MKSILAIDPGLKGALVFLNDDGRLMNFHPMPLKKLKNGKCDLDFRALRKILKQYEGVPIFLERAVSFGMGSTGAFNYGRGFGAIEIAIQLSGNPVTYVMPAKWTKVMHVGIDSRLKPKERSLIALKKHFPKLMHRLPKNRNGKIDEGGMDALLIAGYARKVSI